MNFGMIPYEGLTEESFVFHYVEQPYLSGTKNPKPIIHIGLSRWTYKEHLKKGSKQFPQYGTLPFYAGLFNSVEMNSSYYAIPSPEQIAGWYKSVDSSFRFCPKLHKAISHQGKIGAHKIGVTNEFIQSVKGFKDKLGQSFLTLNETAVSDDKEELFNYLKKIPTDFDMSVELRNESWFSNGEWFKEVVKQLNAINKGLVICDTPGRRDAVHMHLSTSTAFVRFVCQGDDVLDMFRIEQWKKQLKSWYLQGLEKCYFFLHIHNEDVEEDFINYVQSELKF